MSLASLYVYYRIDPAQREALRATVGALFAAVSRAYGVRGRWMRRRDDPETYLEVYEDVADAAGLTAFLQQECERAEFARFLGAQDARHVETFEPAE